MRRVATLSELRRARSARPREGAAAAAGRCNEVDQALQVLAGDVRLVAGVAVVAVGGYGRGELSPHSDIDLLLVVAPRARVSPGSLRTLLYPLWDAGFQVGHAVATPKAAIDRCSGDRHAAMSLLSARFVAGDESSFEDLIARRGRWIAKNRKRLMHELHEALRHRDRQAGHAGWTLAPDLKHDRGGLRDLHAVQWAAAIAGEAAHGAEDADLTTAGNSLLGAREGLHALLTRRSDRLHMELQPAVAQSLGFDGGDPATDLMTVVHSAARTIHHRGRLRLDHVSELVLGGPRRSGSLVRVDRDVSVVDGVLELGSARDVGAALRLLASQSRTGKPVSRSSIERLEDTFSSELAVAWDAHIRAAFLQILTGPNVVEALELIDRCGGWTALIPEWTGVTSRAQHDPYHRYTVDGHSFRALFELQRAVADSPAARIAADEAGDLDAVVMATFLHDVGKGSGEDHAPAGERISRSICARIGFDPQAVSEIAFLVRWHLLLPDTATRRDLSDPAVIGETATLAGSPRALHLLYLLSVADGRATGPDAWTDWKDTLVLELYRKALAALESDELDSPGKGAAERAAAIEACEPWLHERAEAILASLPPSYLGSAPVREMTEELRLLDGVRGDEVRHRVTAPVQEGHQTLTVVTPDRPGALARTAGILALHGVSIRRAEAYSTRRGLALQRIAVVPPPGSVWVEVGRDLRAAHAGTLALARDLRRKAADYRPPGELPLDVRVLGDASPHSTVVEVRSSDALGLLYAVTSALSDLDLDIHVAKVDTRGARVVDVFYVRGLDGTKLAPEQHAEVGAAIAERVDSLLGRSPQGAGATLPK